MEVSVDKKKMSKVLRTAIFGCIALVVLFGLVLIALNNSNVWLPYVTGKTPDPQAGAAAIVGAQTFLSWDIDKGQDVWNNSICEIADDLGCKYQKMALSDLWVTFIKDSNKSKSLATAAELMEDTPATSKAPHLQSWKVTLTQTTPTKTRNQTVYVAVSEVNGVWKYERMMFDEEGAKYNKTPTQGGKS